MDLQGESPKVFKYETCDLLENFPAHYLSLEKEKGPERIGSKIMKDEIEVKAINPCSYAILDHTALPSSFSLLSAPGSNGEDMNIYRARRKAAAAAMKDYHEDLKEADPELKEPESHLKAMLPTFTLASMEQSKG
jgi:hypothetical protein